MREAAFAAPALLRFAQGRSVSAHRRGVCRVRACVASVPLEHRDVPEGHRGLHDTLYSRDDEHGPRSSEVKISLPAPGEIILAQELSDMRGAPRAAVYAIIDSQARTRYVGLTRDVVRAVRGHTVEFDVETVWKVRVHGFDFPKRTEMAEMRDEWLEAEVGMPSGNSDKTERARWEGRAASQVECTVEERKAFEEKKFKLRKAMADPTLVDELEAADLAESDSERREKLREAVEMEDWSGEVDAQTNETVDRKEFGYAGGVEKGTGVVAPNVTGTIVSPFADREGDAVVAEKKSLELNLENVDVVLEEVRPILVADGGNISAVSVLPMQLVSKEVHPPDTFRVTVQLEGACGTCPSSTMTMKHGVERKLREKFGDALCEVVAIADPAASMKSELSVKACDMILDDVRPILNSFPQGGVRTISAGGGAVRLDYSGPESLRYAIELMLKDKLPDVHSIDFVSSDEVSIV